jgi:hypothetical protein
VPPGVGVAGRDGCDLLGSVVPLVDLNHTEQIAIRIFQNNEVGAGVITPRIPSSPESNETLDFFRSIGGVEVQVKPAAFACPTLC